MANKDLVADVLDRAVRGSIPHKLSAERAVKQYREICNELATLKEKVKRADGGKETPRVPAKGTKSKTDPGPERRQQNFSPNDREPHRQASMQNKPAKQEDAELSELRKKKQQLTDEMVIKDAKIHELTNRLSSIAGDRLQGNPNIADLSDPNRPTKLAEDFDQLYDNQWTDAYDDLDRIYRDEEKVLHNLHKILRYAYDFCQFVALSQLGDLQRQMEEPISVPTVVLQNNRVCHPDKAHVTTVDEYVSKRFAKQYRKAVALSSVTGVQNLFFQVRVPEVVDPTCMASKALKTYINKCIKLLWLMCVQDPPMTLSWQKKDDPINEDYFKCYQKSGKKVKLPVWPAVFLHDRGPIVSKGFVWPY